MMILPTGQIKVLRLAKADILFGSTRGVESQHKTQTNDDVVFPPVQAGEATELSN